MEESPQEETQAKTDFAPSTFVVIASVKKPYLSETTQAAHWPVGKAPKNMCQKMVSEIILFLLLWD